MQCWQWPPDVTVTQLYCDVSWGDFPILLMELRWLGSFLILLVLFHKTLPSYLPVVLKHWRWVFGMGGIGLAGFTLFLVYAAPYYRC